MFIFWTPAYPAISFQFPARARAMSFGIRAGGATHLEVFHRRRRAQLDAGVQDTMGVKGALTQREELHDLVAEDFGKQWRAEPAVAVLAAGGAAKTHDGIGDVGEQRGDARLPALLGDIRQQVAVKVTVAGMAKQHDFELMTLRRLAHRADVLSQLCHRHAAIFDYLQRAAGLGKLSEDGTRCMAKRPDPLHIAIVQRGLDFHRVRGHRRLGARGNSARGFRTVGFELDQQHCIERVEAFDTGPVCDELQERPVEHLDRRGAMVEQSTDGIGQLIERRE